MPSVPVNKKFKSVAELKADRRGKTIRKVFFWSAIGTAILITIKRWRQSKL